MVLNSLSFCLSVKLLISPSYLNEILAGYSNLGCRFFSFITLSMSCHSLLAWRVSIEISAVILMGIPLCVICCFSLAAFNICSLCLIFVNLINMCLGLFCLGFILFGTLWVSWTWVTISVPILGKFSIIISSSIFSWSFFLSFSPGTPMIQMLGHLTLSQRSLRLSSLLVILFFLFSSLLHLFLPLSSTSLTLSSASVILLLVPSRVFFISFIALFIVYWLFFISSRSLLNISCIFSILVSRLFICNSILFSRFFIIFTIILNSFSGRFPISSSFVWFGGHLSCSFTCWVFLCLFILFILLCLGWPFHILAICGSSLLWRFITVGGVGWVAYQGFLVREACVSVLVHGTGFLLSVGQWNVQ